MFLFHKIITWGYYNHFISYKSCASYYHMLEVISRTLGRSHANTLKLIKTIIILELQCEKNYIWKVYYLLRKEMLHQWYCIKPSSRKSGRKRMFDYKVPVNIRMKFYVALPIQREFYNIVSETSVL